MGRSGHIFGLLVGGVALLGGAQAAVADGGTVRASVRNENRQITAFTSPTPPRAGPVDVSVLVQDAAGRPVPGAAVVVRASPRGRPERVIERAATTDAATNKLLVAAVFELPEPGWWEFRVRVEADGKATDVAFDLEVAEALPAWVSLASWLVWPAAAAGVFGIHRVLVRRKNGALPSASARRVV